MSLETFPFDASEFLEDEPSIVDYVSDALATNDAAAISHALGVVARARGMSQMARDAGLQREHLYRALSPAGRPELNTVLQVVRALGLRLAVMPTETGEKAVIGKSTRPVEEVGLRKEAGERVKTVSDSVRHTEVEVERIGANTTLTEAKT